MHEFNYFRPQTLAEVLCLLEADRCKVLAGGTDLLVQLNRGLAQATSLVDIKGVAEFQSLNYIPGQGLFIGCGVTVNELAQSAEVGEHYPALRDAANSLASYQLRNRATLVGNLCNASPAADLAPPLLVYEAQVHIVGKQGERTVPINEFFTGPKQTVLAPRELVTGVLVPAVQAGDRSVYLKQTRIKGHDLGIVGVAARLSPNGKLYLAMSSVAPTPVRLYELEELLAQEKFSEALAQKAGCEVERFINPISDVRSSAEYRRHMAGVLVKRAVLQLLAEGGNRDV